MRPFYLREDSGWQLPSRLLAVELKPHNVQVTPSLDISPRPRHATAIRVLYKPVKVFVDDKPGRKQKNKGKKIDNIALDYSYAFTMMYTLPMVMLHISDR